MVHGRGATPGSMLQFARALDAEGVAYLAPAAAHNTWYPNSFMAPVESNQPFLDSALATVERTVGRFLDAGLARERVVVLGFSQGACLASEFVARNPDRYGGVVALSGGLIGPEGIEFNHAGDLGGTPVFLGCDEADPHIPVERVHETREVFERLNGAVTERIYSGMGHTINADEQSHVESMLADLV